MHIAPNAKCQRVLVCCLYGWFAVATVGATPLVIGVTLMNQTL